MADAIHYLIETQLSFVAPYISIGRLYTTCGHKCVPHLHYVDLWHNWKGSVQQTSYWTSAKTTNHGTDLPDEVETFIDIITANLPANKQCLVAYSRAQLTDTTCKLAINYCQSGWPKKQSAISSEQLPYWNVRSSLTFHNNLLLYNHCIVIPPSLQSEMLQHIHEGHQGIAKCDVHHRGSLHTSQISHLLLYPSLWLLVPGLSSQFLPLYAIQTAFNVRIFLRNGYKIFASFGNLCATSSVWWPKISKHIVQECLVCAKEAVNGNVPLMPTPLLEYPWRIIGTDLFKLKSEHYLLVVDYF